MSEVHIAADDHFVEVSVVAAAEDDDLLSPGESPRTSNGGLHRLGARADEAGSVETGQFTDKLRCFTCQRCLRPDLDSAIQLLSERIEYARVSMAEKVGPEAVQEVDVNISVEITKACSFGVLNDNRVNHLFPCSMKE